MRALSLPGCACRGAFQLAVMARLAAAGERFDLVAGASSGSISGAIVVTGKAAEAPAIARSLAGSPIVSPRYLGSERSIFGMGRILRETLRTYLPEPSLHGTETELLIATTHAGRYARTLFPRPALHRTSEAGLVIHSNRERADLHEIIVASCYIPVLYAGVPRIDGAVHVDGAVADNTLIDALLSRGADDITVVTPFASGAVARTMFAPESHLDVPPHVRLRVIYPAQPLSIGRFDFDPGRLEEALTMPHREKVIDPETSALRARPA
ncbi:MAG: patatin-like phospholipase family protein [Byssovorax sp.]